ncbi:UPF0146 family protein [uncultured Methanobrevibacter sp.]|jgi:hypothetical protein|uniref:UPF0146 family protein n=1 Tax=uncultured Methanobrevibacter sp. TaxID=253161 RepID=UPI0025E58F4B|nr:UPF0146 family protein [uncultured Methanobrevibacter sp.]
MWNDFANFILNEVDDKEYKIVEVGVGKFLEISEILSSKENITLIRTDINPKDSTVIKDDITKPNMKIYENTDLIYSIRPPSELQPYLVKLANKINAQLIIKPLTNEDLNTGKVKMKLKNFKKASFYCLR